MPFKRAICHGLVIWGMAGMPVWGYAQESADIFVPQAEIMPDTSIVRGDDLDEWVRLQRDLYRLVLTFDAQARQVERQLMWYEQVRIQNNEVKLTHPERFVQPVKADEKMDARADEKKREKSVETGDESVENGDEAGEEEGGVTSDGLTHFKVPTLCSELDASVSRYIQKNLEAMENHSKALAAKTSELSDAEKAEFAKRVQVALSSIPDKRRAEEILYICLYKYKNDAGMPTGYSFEKTMRSWFMLQESLIDAWLGNVD